MRNGTVVAFRNKGCGSANLLLRAHVQTTHQMPAGLTNEFRCRRQMRVSQSNKMNLVMQANSIVYLNTIFAKTADIIVKHIGVYVDINNLGLATSMNINGTRKQIRQIIFAE